MDCVHVARVQLIEKCSSIFAGLCHSNIVQELYNIEIIHHIQTKRPDRLLCNVCDNFSVIEQGIGFRTLPKS